MILLIIVLPAVFLITWIIYSFKKFRIIIAILLIGLGGLIAFIGFINGLSVVLNVKKAAAKEILIEKTAQNDKETE